MLRTVDRVPTKALSNGAIRYGIYDEKGALIRYEYIKREDEPSQEGTPINRNLFEDFLDVGTIIRTDADLSNDDRFFPCNGIFLQQDEYPELYKKIGYKYGGGDITKGKRVSSDISCNSAVRINVDESSPGNLGKILLGDFDSLIIDRMIGGFRDNDDYIFPIRRSSNTSGYPSEVYEINGLEISEMISYGEPVSGVSVVAMTKFSNLVVVATANGIYTTDSPENVWTARLSLNTAAFAQSTSVIVAIVSDSSNIYLYSSSNGTTWTKRLTYASTSTSKNIRYKDGIFLAILGDKVYRSTNGTTWTDVTPEITLATANFKVTNKYFVSTSGTTAYYSEDGILWNTHTLSKSLKDNKVFGSLITTDGVFYDIDGGFRIPFAKGRWIKVK